MLFSGCRVAEATFKDGTGAVAHRAVAFGSEGHDSSQGVDRESFKSASTKPDGGFGAGFEHLILRVVGFLKACVEVLPATFGKAMKGFRGGEVH